VIPAGLFGDLGLVAVPMGSVDIIIGLVYMLGLPKELKVSHYALFCDSEEITNSSLEPRPDFLPHCQVVVKD
jgi:hypothetical protein